MADYYPLVAKAVAGLEKNTGEGRRALYERARSALVAQLRGMNDPPLTEAEITRERLALEEAIRKVEAEAARRGRSEPLNPPDPMADLNAVLQSKAAASRETVARAETPPAASPPPRRERPAPGRTVTDEGLKGFRDVIAEAEGLGEATAQGAKTAREAFAATPPSGPASFERVEPRVEPEGLRTPVRPSARTSEQPAPFEPRAPEPRAPEPRAGEQRASSSTWPPEPASAPFEPPPRPGQQRQSPMRQPSADDLGEMPKHSRAGLIAAVVTVLLILGLAAGAYFQRDRIAGWLNVVRGPVNQAPKEAGPARPKITDRVGQPSQDATPSTPSAAPVAAVAQRVVLYEEDPAEPQGKRYIGSAIWRTETVTPGPGSPPDLAVRADLEIPERRITMTFSLRRNTDQALPASHTIEVTFNLPADFPFGGIQNVPGILMKQAEQTRGAPLAGLAVKVTSGFFLVGLSAVESDMQRNLQLLKERAWFDIPIVYNNGRRAILAIEKGTPGERAFEDVFKAWGQ